MGDGCLMEGISHEVCSLAGTLRLSKLVAFYDDNGISIDGHVEGWFTDDTPRRFEAYGWHVIPVVDGHDPAAVDAAIRAAKAQAIAPGGKPTLICCQTVIGQGSMSWLLQRHSVSVVTPMTLAAPIISASRWVPKKLA